MKLLKKIKKEIGFIILNLFCEPIMFLFVLIIPGILYHYFSGQKNEILFFILLILYTIIIASMSVVFWIKMNKQRFHKKQKEIENKKQQLFDEYKIKLK